ncbi:Microcystin-dependent protein [Pedobacter sp. ok626]|uniref:phage tail protein n=1 Tax=Pedobacter sp. ok626 TaxID=1761882 RepID=UPI000890FCCB|nr:tail fiber protein [Pedobacter sp. ok626]SDL79452.1 Microcystin-dependent protein [Pedobacter sp. ok626]
MDAFVGTILAVGFNYSPRGWALCQGQLIPIQQNSALFALLGTTYGGDGQTTFGLPDLRGRVAVGMGTGPGLAPVVLGEKSGNQNMVLNLGHLPAHTHTVTSKMNVSNANGTLVEPAAGNSLAAIKDINTDPAKGYSTSAPNVQLNAGTITNTVDTVGSNNQFSIQQPYLGVNYIIALEGIFPSRN